MSMSDKATRYISQLYDARCNNQWQSIAELVRKVEKHAPSRKCLTIATRADALMKSRAGNDGYEEANKQYGDALISAAQDEDTYRGELRDARVCRAVISYGMQHFADALHYISEPLHTSKLPSTGTSGQEAWFAVSVLKGTLIRGLSFEEQGDETSATSTYRAIISYLANIVQLPSLCPALRLATEELVTHVCIYFSTANDGRSASFGEAMASFHVLSRLLDTQSGQLQGSKGTYTRTASAQFWRNYHATLTKIIRDGLVYHPSPIYRDHESLEHKGLLEDDEFISARQNQRRELKRVESNYENILLRETTFPKANESNKAVRDWVELVMSNWQVLCGPDWTDQELGEGGKQAVSRNTLDILYRAAMKTFHSTQILRHLFAVHTYLAEFDLAFKAFDTYVEIINKGKARIERSGSSGLDLDSTDNAIRLAAEAIRVSCRFGSESAAEKASLIGDLLHSWLEIDSQAQLDKAGTSQKGATGPESLMPIESLQPGTDSLAYHAVAISQATWASYHYDDLQRASLRQKAIRNLEIALEMDVHQLHTTEILYTMALLLAQTQTPTDSLTMVNKALLLSRGIAKQDTIFKAQADSASSDMKQERRLLPLWHFKALLLSSQEDYEGAASVCKIGLEKFSRHLNEYDNIQEGSAQRVSGNLGRSSTKFVSEMENYEKASLLEIKMTQIVVTEVAEGTQLAVNASVELIALYSRLFGVIDVSLQQRQPSEKTAVLPKSSSGTQRSIFGRNRNSNRPTADTSRVSVLPSRSGPVQQNTANFHIAVSSGTATTSNSGHQTPNGKNMSRQSSLRRKLGSGHGSKKLSKKSRSNLHLDNESQGVELGDLTAASWAQNATDGITHSTGNQANIGAMSNGIAIKDNAGRSLGSASNNIETHEPAGNGDKRVTELQHSSGLQSNSNAVTPAPQFLLMQERRFKISMLVKIWLFISRLYATNEMYKDAEEATNEARKLVEGLEIDVSQEDSSIKNFQERGWGGGCSVEELWADVFAERGQVLAAEGHPHWAVDSYEQALMHYTDHPVATTGLCTILLDMYEQLIPCEDQKEGPAAAFYHPPGPVTTKVITPNSPSALVLNHHPTGVDRTSIPHPLELYRLARRDRAYGLLSALTKLPAGWDDSVAWATLARAHETSGQIVEAKNALWRTIALEDVKPARHWRNVGPGGYVL